VKISEFSVKNSLFVNLLSVFIIVAGIIAVFSLNKEIFPNVTFDIVQIITVYPGATVGDVERLVTTPIEKEIKKVDYVEEIRSSSVDNLSTIYVKIDPDASNKSKVVNDIQRAVDNVQDLPLDAKDPIVEEIQMKQIAIIEVAITGDIDEFKLQQYAESLENNLLDLEEVAGVNRRGWREKEIWIEVDPEKLKNFYLSISEIMVALKNRNISMPGGILRGDETEFNIRTVGEFLTAEEIENVIIRANDVGNWLRIKDIATVRDAFEDENTITRSFGGKTINLIVTKKERADAIDLVKKVKKIVATFEKTAKDKLTVYTLNDLSIYITRRLNILKYNGLIAIILVLASLLLFLTRRVAFFTALGIPIAFAATLFFMFMVGMSINMISMFALILVLGMLVDDGIIIAENVYRHIENGVPPREAAVRGTEEVIAPVTTTILTTIVAFLPLAFMTGMMGKFIRAIPIVVIIALIASLLEAFVILPSHLADFAKPYVKGSYKKVYSKKDLPWFKKILTFYTGILTKAMNNRYKVVGYVILFFVFICILFKIFVPIVTFPQKGIEEFYLRAEAPIGTSLDKTNELSIQLENIISQIPENELDSYLTTIGNIFEGRTHDPYTRRGSHLVQINVFLTPQSERSRQSMEIVESLKTLLKNVKGFDKVYFEQIKEGPPQGKAVDIRIKGENFDIMETIAKKYMGYINTIDGVTNVETDYKFGKEEYNVIVDEEKAALAGLTVSEIAEAVSNAYEGGIATYIRRQKAEEEIDVRVRFQKKFRKDISNFDKILVSNKYGNLIMLSKVATLKKTRQLEGINHLDGRRAIRVWATVDEGKISPHKANAMVRKHFRDDPVQGYIGYTIAYRGEEKDIQESFGNLKRALLIALFLIFVILATNFNSLIQPVIVMFTILFGVIGAMIALIIHREAFSFMAFLGMVGMTGVVVNDCIVLIDFINKQRKEGKDRRQSIIDGGRLRLRPVMLTTITTVLGLAPVAYGLGGKDQIIMPAALTMSFGLLFGTVLTLLIIPCIYAIVDDITLKIAHHATVLRNKNGNAAKPN